MATKRRSYFRVESKIARDDFTPAEGWFLVCLMAEMIDRWRVDKLSADAACSMHLTTHQLLHIARRTRAGAAHELLRSCARKVTMTVSETRTGVQIHWPKFAETQGLRALEEERTTPGVNPDKLPLSPAPAPAYRKEKSRKEDLDKSANADPVAVLDAINSLGGRHYEESATQLQSCRRIIENAGSFAKAIEVITYRASQLRTDEDRKYFRPSTLAVPKNFENYRDEMQSGIRMGLGAPTKLDALRDKNRTNLEIAIAQHEAGEGAHAKLGV